jgi:hypothetical protein
VQKLKIPKPNLSPNGIFKLHRSAIFVHASQIASVSMAFMLVAGVGLQLELTSNQSALPAKKHIQTITLKAPKVAKTTPLASIVVPAQPSSYTPAPAPAPKPAPIVVHPSVVTAQPGTPKPEPLVTPSPKSSVSGLVPVTPQATTPATSPSTPASSPSTNTVTGYTSTNWSGYIAANAVFTTISGSWTATSPTANGSGTSADGTWIGIGGVTSNDLIQVGTENTFSLGGNETTSAFYELLPNVSQSVPGITVNPGDSMSASITETSSGEWDITINDITDNQTATLNESYTSSLSSAEWIEEDPSYSSHRQIPFDNFGSASFTNAVTTANGVLLNLSASTAQPVTMVNTENQIIASPSVIGATGASFTVSP